MVIPSYLLSAGLGSKVSTWLTPPCMKIQMTLLALGVKWGLPSGGSHASEVLAKAIPSRWNIAPRTNPVNPIPRSVKKTLRLTLPQHEEHE